MDSNAPSAQADPLDIAAQDSTEKPQNNFFLFANGSWLKKTEIPPAQSSWGAFTTLRDSTTNRLHRILDSLASVSDAPMGSIAQQTGDLFISAMDSAGIEKKGFLPVKAELDSISAIKNKSELLQEIANEFAIQSQPFLFLSCDRRRQKQPDQCGSFRPGRTGITQPGLLFQK